VAPRGGLGAVVKTETSRLFRESNPDSQTIITELPNSRREKKRIGRKEDRIKK
jgi:hypothetical protein